MTQPEPSPTQPETNTTPEHHANPPAPSKPSSKKLPDWQPLGTIRDYFTEQMKHDLGR